MSVQMGLFFVTHLVTEIRNQDKVDESTVTDLMKQ